MDAAQMSHAGFNAGPGMAMSSGLASRRGGQNIKPLSFDALKAASTDKEHGVQTPRTSRSHLLAGLRTAPKSATAATFANTGSPTTAGPQVKNRAAMSAGLHENPIYNGPKTSVPRYNGGFQQQHHLLQQAAYNQQMGYGQQYTAEQVLAPPQIHLDETSMDHMDPNVQAQLLYANAFLSEQQQRLQQQLRTLQAAAQQFQGLNLNGQAQMSPQPYGNIYQQQQQQLQAMQAMMGTGLQQPNVFMAYDPATGQQTLYVDQGQAHLSNQYANQVQFSPYGDVQQHSLGTPRVQVSPTPPESAKPNFRNTSPPRRFDQSSAEPVVPLPPPSANAFRRGHKKSTSFANSNKGQLSIATDEMPLKSAGPKTSNFPLTPMTAGGYGPGQARAGEHPVRQPRNPPSLDELKAKPTAKHDGSKNFATRTRRSALNNLVRAGLERRKDARSSGSVSPISESTADLGETPLTDNDSDSGHSGSGSLVDNDGAECSLPSSRTSTGSWGAIGSDRPSSRQKVSRNSVDGNSSDNESVQGGSFASLLKGTHVKAEQVSGPERKAPMLVLTSAEKRKVAA